MRNKKILAVACSGLAALLLFKKKNKRRMWSKNWFLERERYSDIRLLYELRKNERQDFKNYLRMDPATFHELLMMLGPYLQKHIRNEPLRDWIFSLTVF